MAIARQKVEEVEAAGAQVESARKEAAALSYSATRLAREAEERFDQAKNSPSAEGSLLAISALAEAEIAMGAAKKAIGLLADARRRTTQLEVVAKKAIARAVAAKERDFAKLGKKSG